MHSCTQFKTCLSLVLLFICLIHSRYSNIESEEDELNTFTVEVDKCTEISRKSVQNIFKQHRNCSYKYQINHHRYLQGLTATPVITFKVVRIILLALYQGKILENKNIIDKIIIFSLRILEETSIYVHMKILNNVKLETFYII